MDYVTLAVIENYLEFKVSYHTKGKLTCDAVNEANFLHK